MLSCCFNPLVHAFHLHIPYLLLFLRFFQLLTLPSLAYALDNPRPLLLDLFVPTKALGVTQHLLIALKQQNAPHLIHQPLHGLLFLALPSQYPTLGRWHHFETVHLVHWHLIRNQLISGLLRLGHYFRVCCHGLSRYHFQRSYLGETVAEIRDLFVGVQVGIEGERGDCWGRIGKKAQ